MKKLVVVGGGISGLAAAHRALELEPDLDVTVLEAGPRTGGALRSEVTEEGYVIERGPDSILTTKPAALELAKKLGLEDRLVRTRSENRGAFVVTRGKLIRIPEGFNVVAPSALISLWRSPILSPWAKFRSALELFLPRGKQVTDPDESLGSFVRRRFGQELLDRLAQPMAGGIYGAPPDRLSLRATMPRFLELEASNRSVTLGLMRQAAKGGAKASGARYGLFVSFDKGVGVLPERLTEVLGDRIRLNAPVQKLERNGSGWRLHLEGETIDADAVILTTRAYHIAPLVEELSGDAAAHLRSIPYGSAATVCFAYDKAQVPHPMNASGFVVPAVEGQTVLASTWFSSKWPDRAPEGKALIRVFLGGNDRDEVASYEDDALLGVAQKGLKELMGIEAEPELHRIDRFVDAMPRYEVGHLERMDRLDETLAAYPTLALTGSWYRGVGIPDSIANAQRSAEAVLGA